MGLSSIVYGSATLPSMFVGWIALFEQWTTVYALPAGRGLDLSLPNKALTIQRTRPLSSPRPRPRLRYGRPETRPCPRRLLLNPWIVQKGGSSNGTRNR